MRNYRKVNWKIELEKDVKPSIERVLDHFLLGNLQASDLFLFHYLLIKIQNKPKIVVLGYFLRRKFYDTRDQTQ